MNCDITGTEIPMVGTGEQIGYVNAMIVHLDEKPADLADAAAALLATYQTKLYQDDNRAYLFKFANVPEARTNEPIIEEMTEGDVTLGAKLGIQNIELTGGQCTIRTIHKNFKSGQTCWAYQVTNKQKIVGKDGVVDETLAPVRFKITSTIAEGSSETLWKVILGITLDEDYYENIRPIALDWSVDDLVATKAVTLQEVSSSTTVVTVRALLCGICDATQLDDGQVSPATNFIIKDSTGTPVVPSATSITGNEYELTATLPADTYTLYYDTPATTDEPYVTNTVTFTTT
jgi:hypothetical protein